ncbi:hypothetical protein VTN77DRAFT_5870 [Rasamsonia byssochlamydoides]|uniref:uncharacterized protein n=1 Tax=Rasamsonia byssochlamydoides TaxID=89139 RepID=UPI0037444FAA
MPPQRRNRAHLSGNGNGNGAAGRSVGSSADVPFVTPIDIDHPESYATTPLRLAFAVPPPATVTVGDQFTVRLQVSSPQDQNLPPELRIASLNMLEAGCRITIFKPDGTTTILPVQEGPLRVHTLGGNLWSDVWTNRWDPGQYRLRIEVRARGFRLASIESGPFTVQSRRDAVAGYANGGNWYGNGF